MAFEGWGNRGTCYADVRRGRANVSAGTRYLPDDVEIPVTLTDAEVGLSEAIYEDLPAASSSPSLVRATTLHRAHEIQRVEVTTWHESHSAKNRGTGWSGEKSSMGTDRAGPILHPAVSSV